MTQQPDHKWSALREVLASDIRIFGSLAAEYLPESSSRRYFEGKAEHAQAVLDSMDTIELPGLAEHTAAACDTITRAATNA